LDAWTAARQHNAARYNRLFVEAALDIADSSGPGPKQNGSPRLLLPQVIADRHIFNQYVIRAENRDELRAALQTKGVGTEIYYPVPLHLQECFSYLGHQAGAFPESERAAKETLALPIYPELSEQQAQYVVQCIAESLRIGA
jgi:dTDP-4-amino-4,6-dideoxygalactose transaminase